MITIRQNGELKEIKWKAFKFTDKDWERVEELIEILKVRRRSSFVRDISAYDHIGCSANSASFFFGTPPHPVESYPSLREASDSLGEESQRSPIRSLRTGTCQSSRQTPQVLLCVRHEAGLLTGSL